MKKIFLLLIPIPLLLHLTSHAQTPPDSLREILGTYQLAMEKYTVRMQDLRLQLEIPGQQKTGLTRIGDSRFRVDHVSPEATMEFVKDSLGKVVAFQWIQDIGTLKWNRINNYTAPVSRSDVPDDGQFAGRYRLKKGRTEIILKQDSGCLAGTITGENFPLKLIPATENVFIQTAGLLKIRFQFSHAKDGKFQQIAQTRSGPIEFVKINEPENNENFVSQTSGIKNGFTHADSLHGFLTPSRTCFDVLFYDLDVQVFTDKRAIKGSNTIRFRAITDLDSLQVDLFANMKIEEILFQNKPLTYRREFNAVFIRFPRVINKGDIEEIKITYAGQPQVADPSSLSGGFIWFNDKNNKPWIESVCQGAGASLWWPCKDHLSDKPDSMKISITVPTGIGEISNGKLRKKTDLPGNMTRFDWYVSYPIVNYDVVVNIGDYVQVTDQLINDHDTLAINYYSLANNSGKAQQVFEQVKPMLTRYQKWFGPYPFKNDGFTIMESLYPMEHQGAISFGSVNNPVHSNRVDLKELVRTMGHESAHEWWGNNITCSDMADLWIHEAFATYTEVLNLEAQTDRKTAIRHLHSEAPDNQEPVIGVYGVNHFHLGDMYSKGALMLHTFRSVLNNDSVFFTLLRELQTHFRYQSVNTAMIVSYVNEVTQKNFTPFFDQYLKFPRIPELQLKFETTAEGALLVSYRWSADAKRFDMPIKISTVRSQWMLIYPRENWTQLILKDVKADQVKVDTENFYVTVKRE